MCQNAGNLTKNAAFAKNYHINKNPLNFVAIFSHNLVTANRRTYRKLQQITEAEVGKFLYFDCKRSYIRMVFNRIIHFPMEFLYFVDYFCQIDFDKNNMVEKESLYSYRLVSNIVY
jgi:hypothetical protein